MSHDYNTPQKINCKAYVIITYKYLEQNIQHLKARTAQHMGGK